MANTVYVINKGINRPLEFRGLKAQYIWYLGAGLVGVLILYSILYIIGVNGYFCIVVVVLAGGFVFLKVYQFNNTYGQYGLARKIAKRKIPKVVKCNSRKFLCKK
jgi:hypothetical protein